MSADSTTDRFSVLDPDMRAAVEVLAQAVPVSTLTPVDARAARAVARAAIVRPLEEVGSVEDRTLALEGRSIVVRIVQPAGTATARPALVHIHGGGWVLGTIDDSEPLCRQLANRLGAVVVSIDYRLAPEHPYPAPLDDCYDAWRWVLENSAELGIDPSRVAVGGDSAGGNLAAAIGVRALARGVAVPAAQLLVYPATRLTFSPEDYNAALALPPLTVESMIWFNHLYLGTKDKTLLAEVSPLFAEDLGAMPPAVIVTAKYDILRPEIEAFAERLQAAGVAVRLLQYDGVVHGFFGQAPLVARATEAVAEASAALRALLA